VPSGCSFHLGQMCGDIVCTVWFLQDTDDSKEANLKVSMADVEINLNVGQSRSTTKESSTVALPRFVNTRVVDEGTALVYCQPPKEDTKSLKRPYDAIQSCIHVLALAMHVQIRFARHLALHDDRKQTT